MAILQFEPTLEFELQLERGLKLPLQLLLLLLLLLFVDELLLLEQWVAAAAAAAAARLTEDDVAATCTCCWRKSFIAFSSIYTKRNYAIAAAAVAMRQNVRQKKME